jgi:hypothetical protein
MAPRALFPCEHQASLTLAQSPGLLRERREQAWRINGQTHVVGRNVDRTADHLAKNTDPKSDFAW